MALLPLKPCLNPGCPALVRGKGRCPEHQAKRDAEWNRRRDQLRAARADRYALYRTPEWRRLRSWKLVTDRLCVVCGERATVVDHIRPHLGELQAFLDPANLQSMCKRCHDQKTSRVDSWNRKRA